MKKAFEKKIRFGAYMPVSHPDERHVKELGEAGQVEFGINTISLICGPPIMIKFVLGALGDMGVSKTQIYTTLELRMKCGVGKCGRCNIGSKYVCKDGPVFRFDEVDELPPEF